MGDELVMMDASQGQYFGLNAVANVIWQLLEAPKSVDELVEMLMQQFDVSELQCRQETELLIQQLLDKKVILTETAA
ncbi:PqqD family protein [Shewanella basaltis]|uniref:PqqD family protein n=1 Tax=Shewanella basaltis TaxID=472183 RepID=UPI003AAEA57F